MPIKNHYQTLGVLRDSSIDEIKKAYRSLAMQNHPDRNPGDKEAETRFKEAAEAYENLRNEEKRAAYDLTLIERVERIVPNRGSNSTTFSDPWNDMFGNS